MKQYQQIYYQISLTAFLLLILNISAQKYTVPYQSHSFNDLGLVKQQLIKGVRFFKNDISLSDKQSCMNFSNWTEDQNECGFYDDNLLVKTCCYALRGDTSATPYFFSKFDNTYDFIDFIAEDKNRYLFDKNSKIERYQQTIIWQFDIQNGETFNPLLEHFMYNVLKTINDLDLNIRMQWGNQFIKSYQNKCKTQCSEIEQYIADQPVLANSGTYETIPGNYNQIRNPQNQDESLIQILNVPLTDLNNACENGINGWFSEFTHPVIFWEPSFEYATQYVYQYWYSDQCKKPQDYDSKRNPLSLACNQQPEMQNVYIQLNNKTMYSGDQYGQKSLFEDTNETILAYQEDEDIFYMAFQKLDSQGNSNGNYLVEMTINNDYSFKKVSEYKFGEKIERIKIDKNYILIEFSKNIHIYKNNLSSKIYNFQKKQQFIVADIISYEKDSQNKAYLVQVIFSDNYDNVQLQIVDFESSGKILQEINLGKKDLYDFEDTLNTDLIFKYINSQQIIEGIFIFNNDEKVQNNLLQKLYAVSIQIPHDGDAIINGPSQVGFGTRPRGNIYQYNQQNYLVLTYGNSTCQVGSTMNNNGWNKCNIHEQPDLFSLVNVEYLLSYMYGQFNSFSQRIQNQQIITGCDDEILVSKYNNGINPTIVLKQFDGYLRAFVAHDYVSYLDLGWASNIMCGTGYYDKNQKTYESALLYQFQVVEFPTMEYGIDQNRKYTQNQHLNDEFLQIEL